MEQKIDKSLVIEEHLAAKHFPQMFVETKQVDIDYI